MSELRQGYALIIGIDSYSGGISPLQSAVADARAIADLLRKEHDYKVERLLDKDASRAAIGASLENLSDTLDEESAFLLYFAGHGVARGDGNEEPQGFLLPHDSRPSDIDSWVSMDSLRGALKELACKHLLVILDCCFAGSFRWASTRDVAVGGRPLYDSQFERYLKGTAWQALTSASADEKALDVAPGTTNTRDGVASDGHSPFAAALMRGLSGAADSSRGGHEPDGVMTATELFQYTFEELVPPDVTTRQTPGIWPLKPDNQGEYIFRNPGHERRTVPDPPLDDRNNPWLGLKAYTEKHRRLFFGRDRVINELLKLLEKAPGLLAVLGASGTGKSSVVKAGLIPRLQELDDDERERLGSWEIVQMGRLGGTPGRQLDAALAELEKIDERKHRLLLIDQFEELYTQSRDAVLRDDFLARLRHVIDDDLTTVVLTLRSDFEPRPAASKVLRDAWHHARYVVPAFTLEEYRDCIEGPAREKAVYFEPASLIDELLQEVAAMPGALPMLSFALAEIYRNAQVRRRSTGANDRALTREDYESTGGMVGAMHRRATILYEDADPASRASIERVFLRMLSIEGDRLARRRVRRQELEWAEPEGERVNNVLKQYVDARLLVADGDAIEPAHDTLIAAWELLLDWKRQSKPQELLRALWRDAHDWDNSNHDKDLLWADRPERLSEAESRAEELNLLETEFTIAGRKLFKTRRLKRWGTAVGVAVVILVIGYQWSDQIFQTREQEDERHDALIAREKLFLDYHGREPRDLSPDDMLEGTPGNILAYDGLASGRDCPWKIMVGNASGALAIARNYSPPEFSQCDPHDCECQEQDAQEDMWAGRILAIGHERILNPAPDYGKPEQFLEHSLAWLETDPESPVYISVGHGERLAGLPEQLEPLQDFPDEWEACTDEDENGNKVEDWFLRLEGIRPSYGPDDPLFAGSALHQRLWDMKYCQIYAVSDLRILDTEGPSQGILIVADAWDMDEAEASSVIDWVKEEDNGLLVMGSGSNWAARGGDLASYPMNRIMSFFGMSWTDAVIRPD